MRHPPSFKDQLKQILVKFNLRLTLEILNLPIYNYEDFLHYVNERYYICSRSIESHRKTRSRKERVDMYHLQGEVVSEYNSVISQNDSTYDNDDAVTNLKAFQPGNHQSTQSNKQHTSNSKPLTHERLERNLSNFDERNKRDNVSSKSNDNSNRMQSNAPRDWSKVFCYNCGEWGHLARKPERPSVTSPPVIMSKGATEENNFSNENRIDSDIKIDQIKDLDRKLCSSDVSTLLSVGNDLHTIKDNDTAFLWEIDDETDDELELTDNELNATISDDVASPVKLSTILENESSELTAINPDQLCDTAWLKNWKPEGLSPHLINRLTQRRIYRGNDNLREPSKVLKIPAEITVFGIKIEGIIDSGSERSYLSPEAYERIKIYQLHGIKPDSTSTIGVRLGDSSATKSIGGTCFIIDIGDVYGPQWFSILPGLSGDLILGMDFWISFKVQVDPYKRTWTLAESQYFYNLSHRFIFPTELKALSVDQTQKLKDFLNKEFVKFDQDSSGMTNLITHVIKLDDTTPHGQKPYRRSERLRSFINKEVDRLLEKGYITWSNSNWASSPVVAPKANGGLRFCIDYRGLNRKTKKPANPLPQMGSILSQLHGSQGIPATNASSPGLQMSTVPPSGGSWIFN
ncbi:hypothetical protein KPH14_001067 [Odynerus spinipes]|uniref:Peptidase A2 domain-containing protein n=1 Tax=Odynerus spinipes TaxID=1348599 RepID=A0AAD9VKR5_9HYME|nr:hypothetical protein KPH14_001067 [Odynerus spinipes]